MGLETYTGYIPSLVDTNPTGSDPKSQGDDHLRGIKKTLSTTFSGFTEAAVAVTVTASHINDLATGAADGATSNAMFTQFADTTGHKLRAGPLAQSSSIDATANRVLVITGSSGCFGLGATGTTSTLTTLNSTVIPTGSYVYTTGTSAGTKPVGSAANGIVDITRYSNTIIKQAWTDINGGSAVVPNMWVRTSYAASTFGPWYKLTIAIESA